MLKNLSVVQNTNYEHTKLYPDFSAKIVYPIFWVQEINRSKNLNKITKNEKGENMYFKLKEFEMDTESIKILMKSGNIISNPDIIRKILFYLESEDNKNVMLMVEEKIKRNLTMRRHSMRKKITPKSSMNLNMYRIEGESDNN